MHFQNFQKLSKVLNMIFRFLDALASLVLGKWVSESLIVSVLKTFSNISAQSACSAVSQSPCLFHSTFLKRLAFSPFSPVSPMSPVSPVSLSGAKLAHPPAASFWSLFSVLNVYVISYFSASSPEDLF